MGVQDGVNPYSAEKHAMQEGIPCLRKLPKLELDMEAQNEYFEGAPRTNRMFFSGAINTKDNIEPSRYEAYVHLRNKTGFKMVQTEKELSMVHKWEVSEPIDSLTEMSKSDFCMVPLGKTGNYGQRDVPSAAVGCLPVFTKFLVADQSLRPSLQWGASSVRLPPPSVRWLEAVMDTYTGANSLDHGSRPRIPIVCPASAPKRLAADPRMFMTHSHFAAAPPPSFAFLLLLQLELGAARRVLLSHVRPSLLWRSLWPRRCLEHEDREGADTFGPIVSNIANRVRSAAEMSAADSFARTRPEARMLADAVREGSCVWYRVDPLTSERPHEGMVNKLAPDAAVDAMGAPLALCDGYRGNAREAFAAATSVECARCPAEAPSAPYNVLQCDARGGQQVLRRDQHDIGAPPASPKPSR